MHRISPNICEALYTQKKLNRNLQQKLSKVKSQADYLTSGPVWSESGSRTSEQSSNSNIGSMFYSRKQKIRKTWMKFFQLLSESTIPEEMQRHLGDFLAEGNTNYRAFISKVCWPSLTLVPVSLSWPTNTVLSQDEVRSLTVIRVWRANTIECTRLERMVVYSEEDKN